jgi:hypothetical protein
MNLRRQKRRRPTKGSPFMHLWPELALMPRLRHWPDRSKPYSPETSDVLAWICEECGCDHLVADKIFQSARSKRVVRFDPASKSWSGVKGGKP